MRLTAEAIRRAWCTHPARHIDYYGAHPDVRAQIFEQPEQKQQIAAGCRWIKKHWAELGCSVVDLDYDWAKEPRAYELGTEAFWQARSLQQISSFCDIQASAGLTRSDAAGIVIRQSMVSNYNIMSPRYWPWEGIHFVVLPQAFFDFGTLIWLSFSHWCGSRVPADGWSSVTSLAGAGDCSRPDPWLVEAIARQVAEPARDYNADAPDAAAIIAREVPFFKTAIGLPAIDPGDTFIQNVSYLLADFSIAHEIGHRIAGHVPPIADDEYLAKELEADNIGFDLFRASWGWRAEILEAAPFDDAMKALVLGPLIFLQTMRLRGLMAQTLSERAREAGLSAGQAAWGLFEHQRANRLSGSSARGLLTVQAAGAKVSEGELQALGAMAANLKRYGAYVVDACRAIQLDELRAASAIAENLGPK